MICTKWTSARPHTYTHTQYISVLQVRWDRCCEKIKTHFGSETVPVVPISCHFCSPAAINSVTVCVSKWMCKCVFVYPSLHCLLSFSNKRKERYPVKLASFIPSTFIIISWTPEYLINCGCVWVCVSMSSWLCVWVCTCVYDESAYCNCYTVWVCVLGH